MFWTWTFARAMFSLAFTLIQPRAADADEDMIAAIRVEVGGRVRESGRFGSDNLEKAVEMGTRLVVPPAMVGAMAPIPGQSKL